ncbi:MAG: aspartate/glutamate racemase family protein [Planctomycetota bacterium]|jgi:aspartate racemase
METIGLIGGMSWESSLEYYRIINRTVREMLGGLHCARIVMHSFDFAEIAALQAEGDWEEATRLMIGAAQELESAGADFLVICCNTMHKLADYVQKDIRIPLLHIADATAQEVWTRELTKVGLIGTRITMEENFFKDRLVSRHNVEVMTPDEHERQIINDIVFNELCRGETTQHARQQLIRIMKNLAARGAEGIILGCTELGLLIDPQDIRAPVFDTTTIHARSAALYALEK